MEGVFTLNLKLLRNVLYMFAAILAAAVLGYALILNSGHACSSCGGHAHENDAGCAGEAR